ncbi:hypothetical protein [Nocardioides sp.]|uniref:hypothetical protein n=1 Tax=Nocardioides sp. TaxID=35761 RepID=UPI003D13EC33
MSGVSGGWGSIQILEEFFEGVVGDDITGERIRSLDFHRGSELISRLCSVVPPHDPGHAGAVAWRTARTLESRATLLIDFSTRSNVPACAIYAHQLLIDDPVSFPPGPPKGKGNVERLLNNLSYDIAPLARLRPLIEESAVVLYPSWVGVGKPQSYLELIGDPEGHDEDHRASLWGQELTDWVNNLWHLLPQGQVGEVADHIMANLLAASAFDVEVAATGRYVSMLPSSLTTAGAGITSYFDVLVPSLVGLEVADVVALRRSSEVFTRMRSALNEVAEQLPNDPERARRVGPDIARDVLKPLHDQLMREVRRSPTLAAAAGAAWTMSLAGADFWTGSGSVATAVGAATAPIPLLANWVANARGKSGHRAATRIIQTFS